MATHTPGPWVAKGLSYKNGQTGRAGTHYWITDAKGHALVMDTAGLPNGEPQANAYLLAAAPVMLEALKQAQDAMARMDCGEGTRMRSALEAVERALSATDPPL